MLDVAVDPAGGRRWWAGAPMVLVGVDAATACARAGAARRPGVVDGEPTACARAAANGAGMAGCRLDGLDLVVTAEVPVAGVGTPPGVSRAPAGR